MDEIIGYKWLGKLEDGTLVSPWVINFSHVPFEYVVWTNGRIEASHIPGVDDNLGIHACRNNNNQIFTYYPMTMAIEKKYSFILVKVLLSGIVIEGEHGYRAQYADVIDVLYETPFIKSHGYGIICENVIENFIEGELKCILERL